MTLDELKQLITDWARIIPYGEGNTEDAEGKAKEAIELIELHERGEIDMTDEMIDAGLAALYSPHARFRDGECLVAAIFEAMIGASPYFLERKCLENNNKTMTVVYGDGRR